MKDLLRPMYRPRTQRFWLYVPLAAVVAAVGSMVVIFAVYKLTDLLDSDAEGPSTTISWAAFFSSVVLAPAVETVFLLLTVKIVQVARLSPVKTAALAALVWGGLHAFIYPVWFFGTVWSFFVYACAAIAWQQRSDKHAYFAAALPHALVNLGVFAGAALLPVA